MSEMMREQVVEMIESLTSDKVDGVMAYDLLTCDANLRAQLAVVEQERDVWRKRWEEQVTVYDKVGNKYLELESNIATERIYIASLETILEAREATVAELQNICEKHAEDHIRKNQYANTLLDKIMRLEKQLFIQPMLIDTIRHILHLTRHLESAINLGPEEQFIKHWREGSGANALRIAELPEYQPHHALREDK